MNISTLFRRNTEHPSPSRIGLALRSAAKSNYPQDRPPFGRRRYRPDIAGSDRLFFNVRSFGSVGRDHVLQYAFVDDHGNVVLSAFVRAAAQGALLLGAPPGDLATEPLDEARFDDVAAMLCAGSTLVAYQRVLQGGLLPRGAVGSAASVDCAWRRFQQTARRIGLATPVREPITLHDALALARLPPLDSEDAALRALSIRALWRWMDEID
jgi:hypothetical protein